MIASGSASSRQARRRSGVAPTAGLVAAATPRRRAAPPMAITCTPARPTRATKIVREPRDTSVQRDREQARTGGGPGGGAERPHDRRTPQRGAANGSSVPALFLVEAATAPLSDRECAAIEVRDPARRWSSRPRRRRRCRHIAAADSTWPAAREVARPAKMRNNTSCWTTCWRCTFGEVATPVACAVDRGHR